MNKSKSYAEEIVELTKRNERIFLETLHELAEVKQTLASRRTRTELVRDMFVRVLPHQERNDRPTVPSEAAIRLQTRIDAEEFVEKIDSIYDDPLVSSLGKILHTIAMYGTIRSDLRDRLPEFADALADNAVTNEGFAVLFGIDLESVFQEVHASNMRKGDGPIVDGKRRKPEGWAPPDVVGVLRKQGWSPSIETDLDKPIQYAIGPKAMENPSTYATCTVHQIAFDEAFGCARCENAQYNGSEIDPIGEQSEESEVVQEEPQHLMLGLATVSGNFGIGGSAFSAAFTTRDKSLVERCRIYHVQRTTIVPELNGSIAIASRIHAMTVSPSLSMDGGSRVTLEFRKVD